MKLGDPVVVSLLLLATIIAPVTASVYFSSSVPEIITKGDTFTVRAANSMGGLGASSNRVVYGTTSIIQSPGDLGLDPRYDAANRTLRIASARTGELVIRLYTLSGSLAYSRTLSTTTDQSVDISLKGLESGTYIFRLGAANATWTGALAVW